jgi:hypothetical protein
MDPNATVTPGTPPANQPQTPATTPTPVETTPAQTVQQTPPAPATPAPTPADPGQPAPIVINNQIPATPAPVVPAAPAPQATPEPTPEPADPYAGLTDKEREELDKQIGFYARNPDKLALLADGVEQATGSSIVTEHGSRIGNLEIQLARSESQRTLGLTDEDMQHVHGNTPDEIRANATATKQWKDKLIASVAPAPAVTNGQTPADPALTNTQTPAQAAPVAGQTPAATPANPNPEPAIVALPTYPGGTDGMTQEQALAKTMEAAQSDENKAFFANKGIHI